MRQGIVGDMGDSVLGRLKRGAVEAFALKVTGIGLLFLMHMLIGRRLGAESYGGFSYAIALAQVLVVVVPLGWPTAAMRFIAQYQEQGLPGALRGVAIRAHQVTLAGAVLAALVVWMVAATGWLEPGLAAALLYAAILLPLLAFSRLYALAFQGLQRVRLSMIPEQILLPLAVVIGILALKPAGLQRFFMLYVLLLAAICLLSGALFWRRMPPRSETPSDYRTGLWMAVALPIVFGAVGQIVLKRMDVMMLGAMADMETVGLYAASSRIANLAIIGLAAVNVLAAPMLSAAHHSGRRQRVRSLLLLSMAISTFGALPLVAVMVLMPEAILGLFGDEFRDAATVLRILAVGQLVNAVTGSVGFALLMTGRERQYAVTFLAVAAANVTANYVVIPIYGALGAAVVSAASFTLLNGWQLVLCRDLITLGPRTGEVGEAPGRAGSSATQ